MTTDARQVEYWEQDHGHRGFDHPIVRDFAMQRVRFIQSLLDLSEVQSALDVGCGNGFSTYYLREHISDIWAVDRSEFMLARHPLHSEGRLRQGDALSLPFEDGRFDLVYAWEVLHHIDNPVDAVKEMARVSRRYVLVAEPNPRNPAQYAFAWYDPEHRWVLRFNKRYMRGLFEAAGLRVLHCLSGGWIFPNKTPAFAMPLLKQMPYRFPLGISNWVLAVKDSVPAAPAAPR